jgi:hypothetical protein
VANDALQGLPGSRFGQEAIAHQRYDHLVTPSMVGCVGPGSQVLPLYTGPRSPRAGLSIAWPEYAVAPLNRAIETFNVQTCAVLVVTDREAGRHYMGHFTRALDADTLTRHLQALSTHHGLNLSRSQLQLVPGSWPQTGETVAHVMAALEAIDTALPGRVQFRHYPASEFPVGGSIVAYGGKLACALPRNGQPLFAPGPMGQVRFQLQPSQGLPWQA